MMAEPTCIQLDIHGQVCPSCLLLTLKTLNQHGDAVRAGQTEIIVMTDSRKAVDTIPDAVGKMGYQAEVTRLESGYRIRIHGH
jgi:hypothetical protein